MEVASRVQMQTRAASNLIRVSLLSLALPLDYQKLSLAVLLPEQSSFFHKAISLIIRPVLTYIFCLLIMAAVEAESTNDYL